MVLTQMGLLKDTVKAVSTLFVILFFFLHTVFVNFSETNAYKIHGFTLQVLYQVTGIFPTIMQHYASGKK